MTTVDINSGVSTNENYFWDEAIFYWDMSGNTWNMYSFPFYEVNVGEGIGVGELRGSRAEKELVSSCSFSDSLFGASSFFRSFPSSLSVSDFSSSSVSSGLSDWFTVSPSLSNVVSFKRTYGENLFPSDNLFLSFEKNSPEGILFSENNIKNFSCSLFEPVSVSLGLASKYSDFFLDDGLFVSDSLDRLNSFFRSFSSSLSVSDNARWNNSLSLSDSFLVSDWMFSSPSQYSFEPLGFGSSYNRDVSFSRTFLESLPFIDTPKWVINTPLKDSLILDASFLRGIDFSIANISIEEVDLTSSFFNTSAGSIVGYTPFQEFLVGEYDYKDAIVKTTMTNLGSDASIHMPKLDIHVDIPDTDDRGVANILGGSMFVPFNKHYYTKPEVSLVISGGMGSGVVIPKVLEITVEGFLVELRNSSGGLVEGQISWTSKGY